MGCGNGKEGDNRKEKINIHSIVNVTWKEYENLLKEKDRFIMLRLIEVEAENKFTELKEIRVLELSSIAKSFHKKFIYECLIDTFRNFEFYLPNVFAFIHKNDDVDIGKMKVTSLMSNDLLQTSNSTEYYIPVFQQKYVKKVSCSI